MLSAEQIKQRAEGLGASEAAAALGLSPWRSPLELYLEKLGRLEPQAETLPMRIGQALEPVVMRQFENRSGLVVRDRQRQFIDALNPWRWATVDGISDDNALVEAKTTGSFDGWGEEETDQIPLHYVVQVQHGLACTGLALAWVPVLFAARDFRLYRVARNDELIAEITRRESEFWQHVQRQEPPEAISASDLRLRYPQDTGASIQADDATYEGLDGLRMAMQTLENAETSVDAWKTSIMKFMGEAANLTDSKGKLLATWRTTKPRVTFDSKALQNAWPDLHAKFTKEGAPSRPFKLKE